MNAYPLARSLRRLSLLSALAVIVLSTPAGAVDARLIEAAKKEGEVVWYTSLIVNQMVRPMEDAFNKKYPGIKLKYLRSNTEEIILKVINESKANRVQVDIVDGTNVTTGLLKENLVPAWVPDEAKDYPPYLKDAAGHWVATNLYIMAPAYNTQLVKTGTQPKTVDDLLDPKWGGGKMVWSGNVSGASGTGFVGNILAARGEKAGMEYLRKLAKQNIVAHTTSSRQVLDQLMAGEYSVAIQMFNHQVAISAEKGAPIDWISMSPASVNLAVASLVKNSPHPNAGKLLFSYMISEEGQQLYGMSGYLPAKPSVPASVPKLKPEFGGFEAIYFNPDEFEEKIAGWNAIYQDLFR